MSMIIGGILVAIGGLISLIFNIIILVKAFQTSVGWGFISLLVPFGIIVFVVKFWDQCKGPFLKYLGGAALTIIGIAVAMPGFLAMAEEMESSMPPMDAPPAETAPAQP